MFCNIMGFPNIQWEMQRFPHRRRGAQRFFRNSDCLLTDSSLCCCSSYHSRVCAWNCWVHLRPSEMDLYAEFDVLGCALISSFLLVAAYADRFRRKWKNHTIVIRCLHWNDKSNHKDCEYVGYVRGFVVRQTPEPLRTRARTRSRSLNEPKIHLDLSRNGLSTSKVIKLYRVGSEEGTASGCLDEVHDGWLADGTDTQGSLTAHDRWLSAHRPLPCSEQVRTYQSFELRVAGGEMSTSIIQRFRMDETTH